MNYLVETTKLCDYGCGNIATHKFKNGKWCCSTNPSYCPIIISKIYNKSKGRKHTEESIKKISEAKKGNKIFLGMKHSEETKLKISNSLKGHKDSEETKLKKSIGNKGFKTRLGTKHSEETKLKMSITRKNKGKECCSEKCREVNRQRMLNGGAAYCNKFIKNPSKQGVMLRDMVLELYPTADPEHGVFNYSIDVALIENKIAIEYDGYHHFKSPEDIEYHKNRQKKIEGEGWKFLRYNIFQPFPSKEQVYCDINNLICENSNVK